MAISERPDGTYSVRVVASIRNSLTGRYDQIQRKRAGIKTKGEARAIESALLVEANEAAKCRISGVSTLEDAVKLFLEMRGNRFSPASMMGMKQNFESYLMPIKNLPVTKIDRARIENLLQPHLARVSPSTLVRVTSNIRALFQFLLERGSIQENPAQFIRFGAKRHYQRKLGAMSRGEIQTLLSHAYNQSHPFFHIFFVAYLTGARSGELIELKFSDFDFDTNTVTFSRSRCKRTNLIKPPKSGHARTFHVNPELISLVKKLKLQSNGQEYVLPREKQFLRGEGSKVLRAMQADLGIHQTNFHSIRASFITHLLLNGVPLTTVQHIVGHSDLKTTQQYVRLCGSDLVGATDSLQNHSPQVSRLDNDTNILHFDTRATSTKIAQR